MSLSYFPNSLKHTLTIFILKGSLSQHHDENYRPIFLLEIHGKVLDKNLNQHLTLHDDVYRRSMEMSIGTLNALVIFHETISNAQQNKHTTNVALRDVSNAFDKVCHEGLKHKTLRLNIHPSFTHIFSDFITERGYRS